MVYNKFLTVILNFGAILLSHKMAATTQPNIIVILSDDMGWNDVGFHGSNQIPTPNIDALGYNGVILDRYYTMHICTPSRAAFLTGNYPIRSGMQGFPLKGGENRSLPMDMTTMPEALRNLGYRTHLVGKWHLGAAHQRDTPTMRGFETHIGYWNGFVGYFDYEYSQLIPSIGTVNGLDLHDTFTPKWELQGRYATELFTEKAEEVIDNHDVNQPLFLVLSHLAAHTGKNGVELGVPNITVTDEKYSYIEDPMRRRYADIVNILDDSVGRLVKKLSDKEMLQNSVILYFSDNGAQTVGLYQNWGSNWPLRGLKFTLLEGGSRGSGVLYSPLLQTKGYINRELIHISDWMPTFYALAGGNFSDLGLKDGVNQWQTLSENVSSSRREVLLNIDEVENTSAMIIENFKLVNGTYLNGIYDGYYGETGREPINPSYNTSSIINSLVNVAIQNLTNQTELTDTKILELRAKLDLSSCRDPTENPVLVCSGFCLFDLAEDPCETQNVIDNYPGEATKLMARLGDFWTEMVPQTNKAADPNSDPKHYNNTWCTWLDDSVCYKTPNFIEIIDNFLRDFL